MQRINHHRFNYGLSSIIYRYDRKRKDKNNFRSSVCVWFRVKITPPWKEISLREITRLITINATAKIRKRDDNIFTMLTKRPQLHRIKWSRSSTVDMDRLWIRNECTCVYVFVPALELTKHFTQWNFSIESILTWFFSRSSNDK